MIFPVDVVKEWRNNYLVTSGKHCFWRQDVFFYCVTNDHKFGDLKQHSLSHHVMGQKSGCPSKSSLLRVRQGCSQGACWDGESFEAQGPAPYSNDCGQNPSCKTHGSFLLRGHWGLSLLFPSLISAPSYKGSFDWVRPLL